AVLAPQPDLALEQVTFVQRRLPQLPAALPLLGVDERPRGIAGHARHGAGVVEPAVVPVLERSVGQRAPDDLRDGLGKVAVAALAGHLELRDLDRLLPALRLLQERGLLAELPILARQ